MVLLTFLVVLSLGFLLGVFALSIFVVSGQESHKEDTLSFHMDNPGSAVRG